MDACARPEVAQVTVMKAERVGGSEAFRRVLGWSIDVWPTRWLFVYPNDSIAAKQNRMEVFPSILNTPVLRARLTGETLDAMTAAAPKSIKRAKVKDELRFDRMAVVYSGSGSQSNVEGLTYGVAFVDEVDRCKGKEEAVDIIKGRGRTVLGSKVIAAGTPSDTNVGIHKLYMDGSRARYHVPCPQCGHYHARHFSMVRWPGLTKEGKFVKDSRDPRADPELVKTHAFLECPNPECRHAITHARNMWQIKHGRWVHDGQTIAPALVSRDGSIIPGALTGTPRRQDHLSYHIHGLDSVFPEGGNPYGYIASEYVENQGHPGIEWSRRRLGEAWSPKGEAASVKFVKDHLSQEHVLRGIPPDVVCLTAAADVQPDHSWYEITGLTGRDEDGQREYLIDFGMIHTPKGKLSALEQLFLQVWDTADGRRLSIVAAIIDSGHRANEVYDIVRGKARWFASKGMSSDPGIPWKVKDHDRYSDGRPMPGGVQLMHINTYYFKQVSLDQVNQIEASLGSAARQVPKLVLPRDTTDEYIRQVTAEKRVQVRARGGRKSGYEWVLVEGQRDNHAFDCRVYHNALHDHQGASQLRPRVIPGAGAGGGLQAPEEAERGRSRPEGRAKVSPLLARNRRTFK